MTDKEKLQQLFDAALKDPSIPTGHSPKRAFPLNKLDAVPVPAATTVPHPSTVTPMNTMPFLPVAALPTEAVQETSRATMANVLDYAANAELAALMDMERERKTRNQKMTSLGLAALLFLGLTAGGFAWFMRSQPVDETEMGVTGKAALQQNSHPAATEGGDLHKATAALEDDPSYIHEK